MAELQQRAVYLLNLSLSPDQTKTAGEQLAELAKQAGFVVALLGVLQDASVPPATKHAASIYFKNHIKQRWEDDRIAAGEKEEVKRLLVPMMLSLPPQVARQVAEALSIVSLADFPAKWPALLPELVARFAEKDWGVLAGVLSALAQVLKRYRSAFKSDQVLIELKYILEHLSSPLLSLFNMMMQYVESAGAGAMGPREALASLRCLKLMAKIFFCLNCVDLPEFFEDHMAEWMGGFRKTLAWGVAAALPHASMGSEDGREALLGLQAAVCKNANLYSEKYEEEFNPYVEPFLSDVWQLLLRVPDDPKFDNLAIAGVKFLTGVTTSVNHKMFGKPEVLQSVCMNIVLPNIRFRESDEELFEDTPKEYIRRDMEGSDATTRRRAATELVKGLRKNYEQMVTQLFASDVTRMLDEYSQDRAGKWQSKDAAIFLVTALAVRGVSAAQGATQTNELVPVASFFLSHVLPDLQRQDTHPVIKADCLKFISTFRKILTATPTDAQGVLSLLIAALSDSNPVVSTYAAAVLERVLVIREDNNAQRFTREAMTAHTAAILPKLFKLLSSSKEENEYVMRAIMRVFASLREGAAQLAQSTLPQLLAVVKAVLSNPRNPTFNHYLFESIAVLARYALQANPAGAASLDAIMMPTYQEILGSDVAEFTPYVFQLMALTIEMSEPVSPAYLNVFPSLLTPALWERNGNVPALVRLLQAYLRKCGRHVLAGNHLPALLGVFQRLLALSSTDSEGFRLLNSIVEHVESAVLAPYMPEVLRLVLLRLHNNRSARLTHAFAVLACHVGARLRTGSSLAGWINSIQAGMFAGVVEGLLVPGLRDVHAPRERKMVGAGLSALLFRTPEMLDQALYAAWAKAVTAACDVNDVYAGEADGGVVAGVGTTFSLLVFAARQERDPLPDLPDDTRGLFCTYLHELSKQHPGKMGPVLQTVLREQYPVLLQWMSQYQIPQPYERDPLPDLPDDTRGLFCTYLHELSKQHPGKMGPVLQTVLREQYPVLLQWMSQYQIPQPYVL
eukprot:m51a1_g2826 hypothetical protein (1019) ;mRNA; f:202592-207604